MHQKQQCPRCTSKNYRTNGTTKKGTVRYLCKDCHKSWSDRSIGRPTIGLVPMTNAERQKKHREKLKTEKLKHCP